LPRDASLAVERVWRPRTTTQLEERIRGRNLRMLIGLAVMVLAVIVAGAGYTIYLAKTTPPEPPLPAPPVHAQVLSHLSKTDILDGNFILDSALYRTNQPPVKVIAYYTGLLRSHPNQIGAFAEPSTTILPAQAPEALQHIPPAFHIVGASDANAAQYLYTEYSFGDHDVGVAIDTRYPKGPTLVYMEMLTQPSSSSF